MSEALRSFLTGFRGQNLQKVTFVTDNASCHKRSHTAKTIAEDAELAQLDDHFFAGGKHGIGNRIPTLEDESPSMHRRSRWQPIKARDVTVKATAQGLSPVQRQDSLRRISWTGHDCLTCPSITDELSMSFASDDEEEDEIENGNNQNARRCMSKEDILHVIDGVLQVVDSQATLSPRVSRSRKTPQQEVTEGS